MIGFPKSNGLKDCEQIGSTDAELVRAASGGDKRAFVEIVARYQGMVCGVALGILGNFAASEDAGQEAFLTAWKKLPDLREPERLRPWLAQIARNAALGHLRRHKGAESLDECGLLVDGGPSPDEAAATDEEASLVREGLASLPEVYRLPLVLYYREGESVRSVAELLDISEDAVKQRLARGRQILRDRMSGVIEKVLKRGPGPVFTMSIAGAIGALAAPAVMAGGAFSGAAASALTSGSTPLLISMSTTKAFIATTAVLAVVCIPVGYQLGERKADQYSQALATQSSAPPMAQGAAAPFEGSAIFAEWRALHEKHGTNAAAMPLLHKAISEIADESRRRAFHAALLAEWVQVDAAGGFSFLKDDNNELRNLFDLWLARDPRQAVDTLLRSEEWKWLARDTLSEIARKVPERLPEITERLPKPDDLWDTKVRDAFTVLAEDGLVESLRTAEGITGANRGEALAGVATVWAKSDLDGVIRWARELPDEVDSDEIIRAALIGRAAVDPASALDGLGLVPPGGSSGFFASTTGGRVLKVAARANFDATVDWLAENRGAITERDLLGVSEVVTQRLNADPIGFLSKHANEGSLTVLVPAIGSAILNSAGGQREFVWQWLQTQPESDTIRSLKDKTITAAGYQDPEFALRLAQEFLNTPEREADAKMLAESLLNGGSGLLRFESLYESAPERFRPFLIEEGFDKLAGPIPNPEAWGARLSLLPEKARVSGARALAGGWAKEAPERAFDWAATLPPGESREAAVSIIASRWAGNDPQGAGEWLSGLPPGLDRDIGAAGLVQQIAADHPHVAWEWAQTIQDPLRAQQAAFHPARAMTRLNPATARKWIESGPFDEQQKITLESMLERNNHPAGER